MSCGSPSMILIRSPRFTGEKRFYGNASRTFRHRPAFSLVGRQAQNRLGCTLQGRRFARYAGGLVQGILQNPEGGKETAQRREGKIQNEGEAQEEGQRQEGGKFDCYTSQDCLIVYGNLFVG